MATTMWTRVTITVFYSPCGMLHSQRKWVLQKEKQELTKNLDENLTDLWTFQYISKKVGNIPTSWPPANSDPAVGHCFTNGMAEDRQMLLLESRFSHSDTLDHRLIIYIHVSGYFDSRAKHLKLVGQGLDVFTCNATTDDFRAERGSFYSVLALCVPYDESKVNVNEYPKVRAPSQLITIVTYVEKTCDSE